MIGGVGLKEDSGQEGCVPPAGAEIDLTIASYAPLKHMVVAKSHIASSLGFLITFNIKHIIIKREQEKYIYKRKNKKKTKHHLATHHVE